MLKFLSSMKFGIILMAIIAVASILSTLVPVAPNETRIFVKAVLALPKILMLFLCINLLFCTTRRLPGVLRKVTQDISLENEEDSFQKNSYDTFKIKDAVSHENFIENYFKENKYKFKKKSSGESIQFIAQKGKLSLIAPHLLHVGLAIVLIGAVFGSYFGAEGRLSAGVGETAKVPVEVAENMVVKVNDFKTIYDEHNNIDNWQSDLTVSVDGKEPVQGVTKVNHPFKYKGVVFYQSAYGYFHTVSVETGMGEVERTIRNRAMDKMLSSVLGQFFVIDKAKDGVNVILFETHDKYKSIHIKKGETVEFPNGKLKYLGTEPYTVLTVKRDPGTSIVMLGFLIMSLTSFLFWIGRYREVRVTLDRAKKSMMLKVSSKSKAIKEEIIEELTSKK